MKVRMRVFVYGSLMRGGQYHPLLEGARFVAVWRTPPAWEVWDLDGYPALTPGGSHVIEGEVYEIDDALLARLDELEEVPELYQRAELDTPHGRAFVYVVHAPPADRRALPGGRWVAS